MLTPLNLIACMLFILLTKDREAQLVEATQQIAKQSEDRCTLEQQVKDLESQRLVLCTVCNLYL